MSDTWKKDTLTQKILDGSVYRVIRHIPPIIGMKCYVTHYNTIASYVIPNLC